MTELALNQLLEVGDVYRQIDADGRITFSSNVVRTTAKFAILHTGSKIKRQYKLGITAYGVSKVFRQEEVNSIIEREFVLQDSHNKSTYVFENLSLVIKKVKELRKEGVTKEKLKITKTTTEDINLFD